MSGAKSPFMEYLNAQGVINLALFVSPVIVTLVKDLLDNIIKPIGQRIFFTSGIVADKNIKTQAMINSLIRNGLAIAILTFIWMLIYAIIKMANI